VVRNDLDAGDCIFDGDEAVLVGAGLVPAFLFETLPKRTNKKGGR